MFGGCLGEFLDDCFDFGTDEKVLVQHLELEFGQGMVFEGSEADFTEGNRRCNEREQDCNCNDCITQRS